MGECGAAVEESHIKMELTDPFMSMNTGFHGNRGQGHADKEHTTSCKLSHISTAIVRHL